MEPKYRCVDCGRPAQLRRELGKSLRCRACGEQAMIEQAVQMSAHSGPRFDEWRQRMAAMIGATLNDSRERA